MEKSQGFETCVSITRALMIGLGIWPGTKDVHWYLRCRFLVSIFIMVFFINIPQTRMMFHVWDNFQVLMEILTSSNLLTILACVRLLGLWYYKEGSLEDLIHSNLNYLVIKIAEDWKESGTEQQRIMWTNVKFSRGIILSCVILSNGTVIVYAIERILVLDFSPSVLDYMDNESTTRHMFYLSKFFFETKESPIFEICWIFQLIGSILGANTFSSFDGFFIFSILHLCGQIANLQIDFKQVIYQSQKTNQGFAESLGSIVKRHNQLNRFMNCIEDNFNKVLLIQIVGFSISVCLQGYHIVLIITETHDKNLAAIIYLISYTFGNITRIFLYCFVIEKLRDESTSIFYIIYDLNWYDLKPNESKMLINIMHHAKSPPRITAGKFSDFSLEYFTTVMKTSLGYLSMILVIHEKFAVEH